MSTPNHLHRFALDLDGANYCTFPGCYYCPEELAAEQEQSEMYEAVANDLYPE